MVKKRFFIGFNGIFLVLFLDICLLISIRTVDHHGRFDCPDHRIVRNGDHQAEEPGDGADRGGRRAGKRNLRSTMHFPHIVRAGHGTY